MPIERLTRKPQAPAPAELPPPPAPMDRIDTLSRHLIESNERLALAVRDASELGARKVIDATVERDKDGRILRIRMEVTTV